MKKKLRIAFSVVAIAAIIALNMIVTFQSDNQKISLATIPDAAYADGESGEYYSCFTGTITSYSETVRWCGRCNYEKILQTGHGGCRVY